MNKYLQSIYNLLKQTPKSILLICLLLLASYSYLLFANLGYYALWDDEARTVIIANATRETGDTGITMGHNISVYGGGYSIDSSLKERSLPPFTSYMLAPFTKIFQKDYTHIRYVFAVLMLINLIFALAWILKLKWPLRRWIFLSIILLSNVSLILYGKQCYYYSLTILLTTIVIYGYIYRQKISEKYSYIFTYSVFASILLLTHYLIYAGLISAIIFDYLIWGKAEDKKEKQVPFFFLNKKFITFAFFHILAFIPVLAIWNNVLTKKLRLVKVASDYSWTKQIIIRLWLHLRDLNTAEYIPGLLLIAIPLIYLAKHKNSTLINRLSLNTLISIIIVSIFSPQTINQYTQVGDIRYLCFIFPVLTWIYLLIMDILPTKNNLLGWQYILAIVIFGTNILNVNTSIILDGPKIPLRSTILSYLHELKYPAHNPYGVTAAWLNKNTIKNETAWVLPDYAVHPLIVHAPNLIYGWQIPDDEESSKRFNKLSDIFFEKRILPDYIIVFGYQIDKIKYFIQKLAKQNIYYTLKATLPEYWQAQNRAEIFWHAFTKINTFNINQEAIYIFKKDNNQQNI